jgi:hypothetical protein
MMNRLFHDVSIGATINSLIEVDKTIMLNFTKIRALELLTDGLKNVPDRAMFVVWELRAGSRSDP